MKKKVDENTGKLSTGTGNVGVYILRERGDALCQVLEELTEAAIAGQPTLIHCAHGKDRTGVVRRLAVYTSSRSLPGLSTGAVLRWKNPRFHYFMDGSSGARIEDGDVANIQIEGGSGGSGQSDQSSHCCNSGVIGKRRPRR